MAEGFQVDLDALHQAADGIARTVDHLARQPVTASTTDPAVIGHARLADALDEFAARWQHGVENLTDEGRETAARLVEAAAAYERSDVGVRHSLDGTVHSAVGPDPAAR